MLRRQDGILAQEAHGQTVLLRLHDGSYYALEEVGARIWDLCDGRRGVEDIVAAIQAEYEAPPATIQDDVLEFVADLRREGLLVETL